MKKTFAVIFLVAVVLFGLSIGLKGRAEEIAQNEHIKLMESLLPDGKDFIKLEYSGDDQNIRSVHKSDAGYVIEASTYAYADEIRMFIGVNNDGAVTGLVVYDAHETLGLGSRILTDHEFLSQFLNQSGTFAIGEPGADAYSSATSVATGDGNENYVDGISGATVSSKAVAKCVNSAIAYVTGVDIQSSATTWGG